MITRASITQWRNQAPWPFNEQVEQDLILSRAICELYSNKLIQEELIFRGGTALNKLYLQNSSRFSEDLDFVQRNPGPIGNLIDAIRSQLDPWLGSPKWKQGQGRFTLYYAFETEFEPKTKRKVKVEINTREHFSVHELIHKAFQVENSWFSGSSKVLTYALEELLGSKLRALYQRKKGRDLYDFWVVVEENSNIDIQEVLRAFDKYMQFVNCKVSRAEYEKNIAMKMKSPIFLGDIEDLLSKQKQFNYQQQVAFDLLFTIFTPLLPGESWENSESC